MMMTPEPSVTPMENGANGCQAMRCLLASLPWSWLEARLVLIVLILIVIVILIARFYSDTSLHSTQHRGEGGVGLLSVSQLLE